MSIQKLNPYIGFPGNAASAIELYKAALGAEVTQILRHGEVAGMESAADWKDKIMHCELKVGGGVVMVTDAPSQMQSAPSGMVQIALHFVDLAAMEKSFNTITEGGSVYCPLMDAFWGDKFGVAIDKFGVTWMFVCPLPKS